MLKILKELFFKGGNLKTQKSWFRGARSVRLQSSLELIEKPTALIGPKEGLCNFSAHLDKVNPSNLIPQNRDFRLFRNFDSWGIFDIFPQIYPQTTPKFIFWASYGHKPIYRPL